MARDNMRALQELAGEVGTYAANLALLKQELGESRAEAQGLQEKLDEANAELSRLRAKDSTKAAAKEKEAAAS